MSNYLRDVFQDRVGPQPCYVCGKPAVGYHTGIDMASGSGVGVPFRYACWAHQGDRAFDGMLKEVPQSEPLPGTNQQLNHASGYSFVIDDWGRLARFLILGSEGGTYYQSQEALTRENAGCVIRCIESDGLRVVNEIVRVSEGGLAPKNDPALFALALATTASDVRTRQAAYGALPRVARTGTHLLHFVSYCQSFRGWSRGLRRAVARWFTEKNPRDLAYQAVKYQSRDGWSLRDLTRLSHLVPYKYRRTPDGSSMINVLNWIGHGWEDIGELPHPDENLWPIWGFEKAKRATTPQEIVKLIRDFRLVREAIPTQFLTDPSVWEALLVEMPMEAMLRNLATMTKVGLLTPFSDAGRTVCQRLMDSDRIKKSRLHPIKVLAAQLTYAQGHGQRSTESIWAPVTAITDVLSDHTFYEAFENVEPTGKRIALCLDISGSMGCTFCNGMPFLSCREGSAAMSLVTARSEKKIGNGTYICGFGTTFHSLPISPSQRLDDVVLAISNLSFQGTDCALPMLEFMRTGQPVDAFVIYTDNETWAGKVHPSRALEQYRQKFGLDTKLAVVGMSSTEFSIADPNDAGMMDFVGFSSDTPAVMSTFIRGGM